MRFGKLSYGMELLPYRYRLPGNFRRANFFENCVVDYAKGSLSGDWGDVWGKASEGQVKEEI